VGSVGWLVVRRMQQPHNRRSAQNIITKSHCINYGSVVACKFESKQRFQTFNSSSNAWTVPCDKLQVVTTNQITIQPRPANITDAAWWRALLASTIIAQSSDAQSADDCLSQARVLVHVVHSQRLQARRWPGIPVCAVGRGEWDAVGFEAMVSIRKGWTRVQFLEHSSVDLQH
jgi:hypothetical protein